MRHGTMTAEGYIPHIVRHGLELPVRLAVDPLTMSLPQMPARDLYGRLIYALPGGKSTT